MTKINFRTKLTDINGWKIVKLPDESSKKLPSRGQVYVKGSLNGSDFGAALEPDGIGGHWLHIDKKLQKIVGTGVGHTVELEIEVSKDWPEPEIPADVQKGIVRNPETIALWARVTPMSRWEWLRWIGSTANPETRAKRIVVSVDKLKKGLRRPCCFNRSMCCVPEVSRSGVLL